MSTSQGSGRRAAIKRLAYQPNELARGLKAHRSRVIGIVVPFLSHYFMAGCIQAIHHAAEDIGFRPRSSSKCNRSRRDNVAWGSHISI
jgi:LacI family transcriptional regulator